MISGPDESQVARAKELTEDLLLVVRQEHVKARQAMMEQQMQLQQAQAQYAAYSAYNVRKDVWLAIGVPRNGVPDHFPILLLHRVTPLLLLMRLLHPHHRMRLHLRLRRKAHPPVARPPRLSLLRRRMQQLQGLLVRNRAPQTTPLIGTVFLCLFDPCSPCSQVLQGCVRV